MAITLIQEKKRQRFLLYILIGALGIGSLFFAVQSLQKRLAVSPLTPVLLTEREIEINYEILESKIFEELLILKPIIEVPPVVGRDNPFEK
jgi:hypothetical protein